MLIKYQALEQHLKKNRKALYTLIGSDAYLLNDAALKIKKAWRTQAEADEKIIHIHSSADWKQVLEEANSYTLFTEKVLLDVRFDKKTIDAFGKECLTQYLKDINPRCLIILQASAVSAKQLPWLANDEHTTVIQINPFNEKELQQWIAIQLQAYFSSYHRDIPVLIYQYAQNNMLACAQVIEKLKLIYDKTHALNMADVEPQLLEQSDFQLYELADACLAAHEKKVLHLLRYAENTRSEPTLILWLLTQEIRQLIQLWTLHKQSISFANACSQLKIWPKKIPLYQAAFKRLSLNYLYQLLENSKQIDEQIKTSQTAAIWHALEKMALYLCWGENSVTPLT
jgi:DNA polymerase-3 subunit delta